MNEIGDCAVVYCIATTDALGMRWTVLVEGLLGCVSVV